MDSHIKHLPPLEISMGETLVGADTGRATWGALAVSKNSLFSIHSKHLLSIFHLLQISIGW